MTQLDWALLQSFAAVGEHGSLSAAARATGTSQPTMSRHVSDLETRIGARLFERTSTGIELTPAGARLMAHAREMSSAAERLSLTAAGQDDRLAGSVRITASNIVATYVLPDILTALRIAEPDIEIELVSSDRSENLLRREADIAVRMYRPEQPDVIAKKLGDLPIGMFAARSYIDRRGMPQTIEDILGHDVVGYDRSTLVIDGFARGGLKVDREFFAFRSDDQVVCWQMVVAGYGIGFNQVSIGEADPRVVRIPLAGELGSLPVWLVAHAELKATPRIRRVYDFLAEQLTATYRD
ncbi:LysR family transcriptional regulator [Hyphomonas sp.]|uniref:LysR family transcriptional regulator n=1 Tax=Hyphomonas sp. TaxID=87 RepID=UPI0025BA2652|nr:LysR family transcriptional regulator [Hyphomonas sp.]MBI1400070.1 LysR family transcriptional regulator [Hyphomonas sp.]